MERNFTTLKRRTTMLIGLLLLQMLCLGLPHTNALMAQNKGAQGKDFLVRGTVQDEQGNPVPGATVQVKGTGIGAATGERGNFVFAYPDAKTKRVMLQVSFVGMTTQTVEFKGTPLHIVLREDTKMIDDVVITGYQTLSKRESASAISSIKASDIMMQGVGNIDQMMQGTIPGVAVMTTSGEPSSTPKIRIRGNATINGNKSPVWVVDGVILEQDVPFTASDINSEDAEYLIGNAIAGINPQDIETITVLKDASATAIYGVKAANGVIVITTKKGKVGRPIVTYNGNLTLNTRPSYRNYNQMNSQERVQFAKQLVDAGMSFGRTPNTSETYEGAYEMLLNKQYTLDEFQNKVNTLQTRNTDWFDHLFRNNVTTNHTMNISGGTDRLRYYVSAGYSDVQGSAKTSYSKRFNTLAKVEADINKHINVLAKMDFSTTRNRGYTDNVNPFNYAFTRSRTMPAYNDDGSYYMSYESKNSEEELSLAYGYNILKELATTGQSSQKDDVNALLQLNVKIIDGLKYQGTFAWSYGNTGTRNWATDESNYMAKQRGYEYGVYSGYDNEYWGSLVPYGGYLKQGTVRKTGYTIRNQASYVKLFNDVHYVNVLAGIEARRNAYEGFSVQNYGWTPNFGEKYNPIMTDTYKDWLAKGSATPTNNNSFTQVASFYGTAAYSYADRYVLNFNMRSDGSNKFGSNPKYRWQPTYSFALKWNMMNEDFMAQYKSNIDYLSFRGSYGTQGNISVDDSPNLIIEAGKVDDLLGVVTSNIYRLPNPDLRWEKTRSWDAAFDFSLLKGRIRGSFDTYGKYTNDLIMSKFVASSNGMSSMYYNAGKMTNKGFEGFVNASLYKNRDWEWRVGVNFSRNINKITLANLEDFSNAEIVNRMMNGTLAIEGAPIGTLYSYHFAGLNEENGLPMFYTKDGRKSLMGNKTDMELVDCGSIFPKLTGGFDTQLTYKDFSLSMAFTYSLGAVGRLPEYYAGGTSYIDPLSNVSKEWLNCWTNTNTNTNSPAPYSVFQMNTYLASTSGSAYNTYDAALGHTRVYPYEMYNKSDVRVAKANFLKMKMLALSYNFPKRLVAPLNVSSLMLRLQITNLFCIAGKDWHGVDPEIGVTQIPSLPTYSLGVNVSF